MSIGVRPGLDGVRAAAVVAVFAYHLRYPWAQGGFLGVDLFMVLSGFLITALLLAEHDVHGRISMRAFWVRRLRRIVPAVVIVLLALATYAAFWATPIEMRGLRWDSLASLTFWANWRFIESGSGYWAQFGPPSPLTHFWSLAVEEQFYLVWPVMVIGLLWLARGRRAVMIGACVAGIAVSVALMIRFYDTTEPSRAYLGTDTRVHTLLIGALGALVLRPAAHRPVTHQRVIAGAGATAVPAVLIAMAVAGDQSPWLYHGGFLAFAAAAMLVVAAAICPGGAIPTILSARWLRWIGQRSFGIYLWHWPLIVILTPQRLGIDGIARDVTLVALTLAAAATSYHFIEHPIRTNRIIPTNRFIPTNRITRAASLGSARPLAAAATVMSVTGLVLVAATMVTSTTRVEIDPTAVAPRAPSPGATQPPVTPEPPAGTAIPGTATPVTATSAPDRERPPRRRIDTVLLQGDSVALFSALPVEEAFAAAGVTAVNRTAYGHSLAQPAALEALAEVPADLSIWQISLWDVGDPELQRARYQAFVDASLAAGMDVVFVDQPPVLASLETEERLRLRDLVRELAAADPHRISVLDPSPVWGHTVELDRTGNGIPERWRDQIHVCPEGSARWTAWLLAELAERYDGIDPGDPAEWVNGTWQDDPRWAENPGQCDPL